MKKQTAALALAAVIIGGTAGLTGCGNAEDAAAPVTSSSTTATPQPAQSPTSAPASLSDLVLSPGAAGPVSVGMSPAEYLATGLLERRAPNSEGCGPTVTWVKPFTRALDVQVLSNGDLASIGVFKPGPATAAGLGVGSTLAEVMAAYPSATTVDAGYGQTGVLVHDRASDGWIGYLFNPAPNAITSTDTVSFIELTEGEKPGLIRDGC